MRTTNCSLIYGTRAHVEKGLDGGIDCYRQRFSAKANADRTRRWLQIEIPIDKSVVTLVWSVAWNCSVRKQQNKERFGFDWCVLNQTTIIRPGNGVIAVQIGSWHLHQLLVEVSCFWGALFTGPQDVPASIWPLRYDFNCVITRGWCYNHTCWNAGDVESFHWSLSRETKKKAKLSMNWGVLGCNICRFYGLVTHNACPYYKVINLGFDT